MSKVILVTGGAREAANYTYENMATFDEVDMGR